MAFRNKTYMQRTREELRLRRWRLIWRLSVLVWALVVLWVLLAPAAR